MERVERGTIAPSSSNISIPVRPIHCESPQFDSKLKRRSEASDIEI